MKTNFFYILTLLVFSNFLNAQECRIDGFVFDNGPKEYVTIVAYVDSVFQSGVVTKEDGSFVLNNLTCGVTYTIKARFVGYHQIEKKIKTSQNMEDMIFNLVPKSNILDSIVVTSKKPIINRKADRLIYIVNESFVIGNNSAFEVLKTTPSLWVDDNGSMRINGKRGVLVMINGKSLNMGGLQLQNYLSGLSGKDVQKIEVIAIPGSEFDANAKGGLINIVFKKKFLDGFNARFFTGYEQGRYPEYSTGVFSNYKKGKLTTTTNFYIFQRNNFKETDELRLNSIDNKALNSSSFSKTKVNNNQFRVAADYDFNLDHNINCEYVRTYNQNNIETNTSSNLKKNLTESKVLGVYDIKSKNVFNGLSLNYKWVTDTLGSAFKFLSDYVYNDNLTNGLFISDYMDEKDVLLYNNTTANELDQISKIYSSKIDYQHNFINNSSLQFGIKYSISNINNDALEMDKIDGVFEIDSIRTNYFSYDESIRAAYINYSGALKNVKYKFGIRIEDSFLKGFSQDGNTNFDVRYTDLFPSTFLLWGFGEQNRNNISLAVNRKINRPFYEDLNPFEYLLNEFSISRGNPSLKPEYSTNVELGYSYQNNYTLNFFYSKTEDIISKILIGKEDISIFETRNISNQSNFGATFSFSFNPLKEKIRSNIYSGIYKNNYSSDILEESLNTYFIRISNSFSFSKNITANLSINYNSKELQGNRIYDHYGQMNFNISKSFFSNKLKMNIGVVDIFNTNNNNSRTVDFIETIDFNEKYQSRKIQIFLFYNINVGKSFDKKRMESSNNGEKSRLPN